MALFASTAEIETYVRCGRDESHDGGSEPSTSHQEEYFSDSDASSGSSKQHVNNNDSEHQRLARVAFGGIFGSRNRPVDHHSSRDGVAKGALENGLGDINKYWQNYDLSISEAPKLFSDAEFEAVKRIQQALAVLLLRRRLKERIIARRCEREVRAAVRVQAMVRGIATRLSLPAIREQHSTRVRIKREYKLFKRELRNDGFVVHLYRTKDGALSKATLKPNGKLNCLCWSMGVAKVKTGSIPLIALKSCYTGYPKENFPTKSMQARATPLPDRSKTFTIQVDTGKVYVFVAADETHGASNKKLAKGLQSIIDEISSPDSFFFDGEGILRRVTSSIFDDRGSIARLEAMKRRRQERFRSRQEEVEARRADLRLKGLTEQDTDRGTRVSPLLAPAELSIEADDSPPPPSRGFGSTASLSNYALPNEQGRLANGNGGLSSDVRMQNLRSASVEGSREGRKTTKRSEETKGW